MSMKGYGTITITDVLDGAQIWTSTTAPTSPNYTFKIANLVGDPDAEIKIGDLIFYSYYRYTVQSISDTTVLTGSRTSIRGETGAQGTSVVSIYNQYYLSTSSTTQLDGSWVESIPDYIDGRYYWSRPVTKLSNNNVVYGTPVLETSITELMAKVTPGVGMKINYSAFNTPNSGKMYIHGYSNESPADIDGCIYWNNVKRTVPKKMINPNAILPYNKYIYIVLRLSSAAATTGTLYMVWYNSGWKYAITPTPSAVGGTWNWTETTDIVLGQFIQPGAGQDVVQAYLYNPPRTASQVKTTNASPYQYSQSAVDWYNSNGGKVVNATTMLAAWADGAFSATTEINGGSIKTHTIQAKHLATNAIMSSNFQGSDNPSSPFSATGTFLDLATGNIYSPNFGIDNTYGKAYLNGEIIATSGRIGNSSATNYWEIGTKVDYNAQQSAALIGKGTAYIQVGDFQLSNGLLDTRSYDQSNQLTYPKYDNTYWDFGVQAPTLDTSTTGFVSGVDDNFIYIRKHVNTIPTLKTDWDYVFRIDKTGMIYMNDVSLDDRYALKTDVGSTYLPVSGGTITGNLTVNGTLNAIASQASKLTKTITINGTSWDGSSSTTIGTMGVQYGGTGVTTFTSGYALIGNGQNAIQTRAIRNNTTAGALGWTSSSADNTLITTNTLAYWDGRYQTSGNKSNLEYVKLGKLGDVVTHDVDEFITTDGGIIDGSLQVTDLTAGNLIVTGAARFVNGAIGDLTGNASTATTLATARTIQTNLASTSAASFNGSANITPGITGTLGVANGGTGQTSAKNAANAFMNALDTGSSTPVDTDYYISQYVSGGTTTTTYHRRPMSALWAYVNGKISSVLGLTASAYGGNAASANQVNNNLIIKLASGTTEGTNMFTYNGSAGKTINITKASIGLGNVENKGVDTSIAAASTSTNLPTSQAVAAFVEGKGYITNAGVTSVSGTSPVSASGTSSVTISLANGYGDTKNPYGNKNINLVLASPASGSAGTPAFRALVENDIPTLSSSKVGLGSVTNNKQVKGLASGTTNGHFVIWGSDGYTVADSGYNAGQIVKSLASNNDGKLVLTYLDNTTSAPIEVKIIGSSGSSVSYADALNVNGTAVGSATQPVYINNQGKPVAANSYPTTTLNGTATTAASFYAPTNAGTNNYVLKSNGSGAPSWVAQSTLSVGSATSAGSATKATQDSDGNTIKSTYLKLSGGTLTNADKVYFTANNGTIITSNGTSILQSPIPKYLWHDVWGFCKAKVPTYYTTTNGTTWTEGTLEKRLFAHMEAWGTSNVLTSTIKGSRWTWLNGGFYASGSSWLVFGITYKNPVSHWDMLLETSNDSGSTWTTLTSVQNLYYSQQPIWIRINGTCQDSLRLTITNNSNSESNAVLGLCSIRLLTSRWGDQGKGSEYEYPYSWDGNCNMTTTGQITATQFNGALSGNAATATKATQANITTTTNAIAKYSDTAGTFADSNVRIENNDLIIGSMDGSTPVGAGNIKIGVKNDNYGIMPNVNNYNQIGASGLAWYRAYVTNYYGTTSHVSNWDSGGNIGSPSSSAAASTRGTVNFYNTCAAGGTQTKTSLTADSTTASNITLTLPKTTGTIALTSSDITGNAATATIADSSYYPRIVASNEIRFHINSKPSNATNLYIGYAWSDGSSDAKINRYIFENGAKALAEVQASTFYGALSGNATSATKATQDSDGNAINTTYAKLSGATFTGAVAGTSFGASGYLAANTGNSGTTGGIALYHTNPTTYGIAMRGTGNGGKHGYVQGDWAIYNYMSANANVYNRGWIWRSTVGSTTTNVASISGDGSAVFSGSVTVGGNVTNDSGCRMEYNVTTKSLDFVFN